MKNHLLAEVTETLESGSNMLASVLPDLILKSVEVVLNEEPDWEPPEEYLCSNVSSKVAGIMLGYI